MIGGYGHYSWGCEEDNQKNNCGMNYFCNTLFKWCLRLEVEHTPQRTEHHTRRVALTTLAVPTDTSTHPERRGAAARSRRMLETVADKELCAHSFRVLLSHLDGKETPSLARGDAGGLFVTFNKRDGTGDYDLRGCIGSLSKINVGNSLAYYTMQAALHDTRFSPIQKKELPDLSVGVSLLHTFETAPGGVYDWQVGTHGIVLNINHHGRTYQATFLPEVAPEQEWTVAETVSSLARKAGFRGKLTEQVLSNSSVTRYQSAKCALTWQEFEEMEETKASTSILVTA